MGGFKKIRARLMANISKAERGERRLDVVEFLEIARAMSIDPFEILRELGAQSGRNQRQVGSRPIRPAKAGK